MNRLEEMQVFVRVVEAGSLTAAAEQLNVAKSAVSRRLAGLEKRLGVRLLTRTTRRMALTAAGQDFYSRASAALAAVEAAEAAARASSEQLAGRIRLAAPLSFGISHLGPALRDFTRRHPEVEFDIDLNDRRVDLVAEGFDLAIRIARLADSLLAARRLTTVRRAVLASPAWWDEHGRPATPAELAGKPSLEYAADATSGWAYTDRSGRQGSVRLEPVMRANNGEVLRDAAIDGLGVILQPSFIVHEAVMAGALEPALVDCNWHDLDAWAVYPVTRFLPQRVRALVDFLAERFGEQPYWDDCLQP